MKVKDLKFRVRYNEDWKEDGNTPKDFVWSEPFTLMDSLDSCGQFTTQNGTYLALDEDFEIEMVEV